MIFPNFTPDSSAIIDAFFLAFFNNLSNNISSTLFYQFGNSFYQIAKANGYNENLKWEESLKYNLGLDFGFANNRVTGFSG